MSLLDLEVIPARNQDGLGGAAATGAWPDAASPAGAAMAAGATQADDMDVGSSQGARLIAVSRCCDRTSPLGSEARDPVCVVP